jgi:CheY-like chemotaxis protein
MPSAYPRGHGSGWATTAPLAGLRILLTDRGPASRMWMRASLEGAGCTVQAVPDGRGAVEAAAEGWFFDLLVADLDLPTMGGVALVGAVRLVRPWLPVVVITALPAGEWTAALHDRCEAPVVLLRKPASAADLLGAVASAWAGRHR